MRILLCLFVLGCDGDPLSQTSPDLTPADTCAEKPITGEACQLSELGQSFTCATWEHDLCCACAQLADGPKWVCLGPHVYQCSAALDCQGFAPGGSCNSDGETRSWHVGRAAPLLCVHRRHVVVPGTIELPRRRDLTPASSPLLLNWS